MPLKPISTAVALLVATLAPALASEVEIVGVEVEPDGENTYRFSVTLLHDDTGWDHYADKWQVVGADGTVYGERILAHPHENEQPFTRSQSGIEIPAGVTEVIIRAGDNVDGINSADRIVKLPGSS